MRVLKEEFDLMHFIRRKKQHVEILKILLLPMGTVR